MAVAAAVYMLMETDIIVLRLRKRGKKSRRNSRFPELRRGVTFESVTSICDDDSFATMFRLSLEVFCRLLSLIKDDLTPDLDASARSGKEKISASTRLGVLLRMLAGAQTLDLMLAFRLGRSTARPKYCEGCVFTSL